jgi:hypothetical protein
MEVVEEAGASREAEADAGREREVRRADAGAVDHRGAVRADVALIDSVGHRGRGLGQHGVMRAGRCERAKRLDVDVSRHRRVDAEVRFLAGLERPGALHELLVAVGVDRIRGVDTRFHGAVTTATACRREHAQKGRPHPHPATFPPRFTAFNRYHRPMMRAVV